MMMNELELLVSQAIEGDKEALNSLIDSIQHYIYNISVKMLWNPEDAKDATQEILIKIVTHLSSFRNESSFRTWTYRIAINYLLNFLDKQKRHHLTFTDFSDELAKGLDGGFTIDTAEKRALVEEVKIGCSNGMLQCLDNESRITYLLGEILEFDSIEGAYIQNISPQTFRQRLSRARKSINQFTQNYCGIVNSENTCRCRKKVNHAIQTGRVNKDNLLFASKEMISSISKFENATELIRSNPEFKMPKSKLEEVKKLLEVSFCS